MLQPPSHQQPPLTWPHEELDALDKRHVQRLLEANVEIQSFFKKHPFFETDPACRLARELCILELPEYDRKDGPDRLITNSGYEPVQAMHPLVTPGPVNNLAHGRQPTLFLDFLVNSNRPRPLWMAWYRQAKAAIDAQAALKDRDAATV